MAQALSLLSIFHYKRWVDPYSPKVVSCDMQCGVESGHIVQRLNHSYDRFALRDCLDWIPPIEKILSLYL